MVLPTTFSIFHDCIVASTFTVQVSPIQNTCKYKIHICFCRYVTFKAQKLHFYLVEFCIYFNVSTYLHTLICLPMTENSPQLCNVWLKSNFVHANGPVLLALFGFRFKLKFANMRQMTSCALHLMPAMNYYLLKWNSNMVQHGLLTTSIQQDFLSLGEQFVYPLIFYLVWQLLHFGIHYVIIFEDKSLRTIMREKNFLQNHPVVKLFMRIGNYKMLTF